MIFGLLLESVLFCSHILSITLIVRLLPHSLSCSLPHLSMLQFSLSESKQANKIGKKMKIQKKLLLASRLHMNCTVSLF